MIKEVFDIKEVQKSLLFYVLAVWGVVFLHLGIFGYSYVFEWNTPPLIGITLGLAVCWSLLFYIPGAIFRDFLPDYIKADKQSDKEGLESWVHIALSLLWLIFLTYGAWIYHQGYKSFVGFAILFNIFKCILYAGIIYYEKKKTSKKKG